MRRTNQQASRVTSPRDARIRARGHPSFAYRYRGIGEVGRAAAQWSVES
jgi:hypothetical protein